MPLTHFTHKPGGVRSYLSFNVVGAQPDKRFDKTFNWKSLLLSIRRAPQAPEHTRGRAPNGLKQFYPQGSGASHWSITHAAWWRISLTMQSCVSVKSDPWWRGGHAARVVLASHGSCSTSPGFHILYIRLQCMYSFVILILHTVFSRCWSVLYIWHLLHGCLFWTRDPSSVPLPGVSSIFSTVNSSFLGCFSTSKNWI